MDVRGREGISLPSVVIKSPQSEMQASVFSSEHATLKNSPGTTRDEKYEDLRGTFTLVHAFKPTTMYRRNTLSEVPSVSGTHDLAVDQPKISDIRDNMRPRALSLGTDPSCARKISLLDTDYCHPLDFMSNTENNAIKKPKTPRFQSRGSATDLITDETDARKTLKRGITSILGVVLFRKLYNARLKASESHPSTTLLEPVSSSEDDDEDDVDEDDTEDMPEHPSWSAQMSTQSQVATLRGYEDVLCDKIRVQSRMSTPVLFREYNESDKTYPTPLRASSSAGSVHLPLLVTKYVNKAKGLLDSVDSQCTSQEGKSNIKSKPLTRQVDAWRCNWRKRFDREH